MNQLAIPIGQYLRDVGIAQCLTPEQEWLREALQSLQAFAALPGWDRFKAEDWRLWWLSNGGYEPHTHHCWAGAIRIASQEGIIRWTGEFGIAVSPKTHGHPVRIWSRP